MGALWIPSTSGVQPRRNGAAAFTTWAARRTCRPCLRHNPIRTIVQMVSRIGKQVGLWPKRRGVASTAARAARLQAVVRRLREDCIELEISSRYFALASVPSSGALDLECVEG